MPRFATRWPTDAFDARIDGVPVVTLTGTDVPDEHAEKLQESARASRVELVELDPSEPAPQEQLFTQSTTTPAPLPAAVETPAVPATPSEG